LWRVGGALANAVPGTRRHCSAGPRTGMGSLLLETGSQKQERRPLGGRRLRSTLVKLREFLGGGV